MLVTADEATAVATAALRSATVPSDAAALQADVWVEAELRGHPSHGLLRLPRLIERIRNGVCDPLATGSHRWTGDALLSVEGQQGLGPVVAMRALNVVTERARTTGVAVAAITASNHLGMLSYYAERVAEGGQLVLALTTSEALVHPWNGRTAMVGSNPIAIGVPADPEPFVLDMATSAVSMGKVIDHANRHRPLEPGWAADAEGRPTTDPVAARTGSISPFGGPKGYGLGLAFEVLVAGLTASALGTGVHGTLDSERPATKGDVFIVFQPGTDVASTIGAYLGLVRDSARADSDQPILVPGDRARERRRATMQSGFEVPDDLWSVLRSLSS